MLFRSAADDKVVVYGGGPVGLSAAIAARYKGAADVVVADLSEHRLGIASRLGFATLNPSAQQVADFLKRRHGVVRNDPLLGDQPGTDVFIEATGVGPVFEDILTTARKGARVVVVGVHFTPVELNMINLLMRELELTAATGYPHEFPEVIAMLEVGSVDVRPLISHRFPLSEFGKAFAQAKRQDEAVKVLVECQR